MVFLSSERFIGRKANRPWAHARCKLGLKHSIFEIPSPPAVPLELSIKIVFFHFSTYSLGQNNNRTDQMAGIHLSQTVGSFWV